MTETKNYKDTLNLPATPFAMKAELARREPEMLKNWETQALYPAVRKGAAGKKPFILHDGPPYANGKIHIGHALNKILKDIIVKYKTMRGFDALYIPGWDCHGLPIEHACLKEMGKRKEEVERVAFRKQARQYAENFVSVQREEFKRLGVFGEWDNPYLTMNYDYQAVIAESFLKLVEKGFIYEDLKPVPWCFDCETALADAELEYEDKTSTSVYVKFPVETSSLKQKVGADFMKAVGNKPVYFMVWTTTPWTLPANVGVAVHPDLDYVLHIFEDEVWILAEARVGHLQSLEIGMGTAEASHKLKGKALKGVTYRHPFLERTGVGILADYVSATDGTGIVHIAPGHGEDDYRFGHLENKLEVISPVDGRGRYTKEFPLSEGVHVFKANPQIVERLKEKGLLLAEESHRHSYPHCWRCRKPVIFRATKQWFMKIDYGNLRSGMLEAVRKKIRFSPEWGRNRFGAMVENRPEWCLSRQRYWGVPIPMIRCKNCPDSYVSLKARETILEIFRKEGADSWFARKAEDFLPPGTQCPKCQGTRFEQETDIIDVWFDSGVSHQAVLKTREGLRYPADLYLEGSDQHRGWFQSSLTTAMALEGRPPYESILTHGFVMDGEGRKMSKSAGNVVAPQEVMKEFGADILRLWVSSCDYQFDVRVSKDILKQLADAYRKIRNTFRYLLGNLSDFDPSGDAVPFKDLNPWDHWAVAYTDQVRATVQDQYDRFEFHSIYQFVHNFCVLQLSNYYFDGLKDVLYTYARGSKRRRSAQTALFFILKTLVKVLAPVLPFTTDEVWQAYDMKENLASVHQSRFPDKITDGLNPGLYLEWQDIKKIRDISMKALEEKRIQKIISSNLEAKVSLWTPHEGTKKMLQKYLGELPTVFVASQVTVTDAARGDAGSGTFVSLVHKEDVMIKVCVDRAEGKKCVRCWNYSPAVGADKQHPEICGKCLEAVK